MPDLLFRILLAIMFSAPVAPWCWFFFTSDVRKGTLYAAEEGLVDGIVVRSLLGIGIAGIFAYIIVPSWVSWAQVPMGYMVRFAGLPPGLVGSGIVIWSVLSLGRNFSTTLTVRKNHRLVKDGPYRWVRHPMYSGFFLLWVSYFLLSANLLIGGSGIAAYILIMARRVPKEERVLLKTFKGEYFEYIKRTGRFFPRIKP